MKRAESDESTILPFADGSFDLVISRHSSFNAAEVARVLAPGGIFFTQQVHGRSGEDLQARFGAAPQWPYATPEYFGGKLAAAGLQVTEMEEWAGKMVFADVGAIVYYLKAVPWIVPDFSVATHLDALLGAAGAGSMAGRETAPLGAVACYHPGRRCARPYDEYHVCTADLGLQ